MQDKNTNVKIIIQSHTLPCEGTETEPLLIYSPHTGRSLENNI